MGGEAWRTAAMNEQRGLADVQSSCWMESELASCKFNDVRHGKRLRKLLAQLAEHIGGSIPWASQDWANTKAAYRFFSNPRISEEEILGGHVQATRGRIAACGTVILMLHDTTEFTFRRRDTAPVGILHKSYTRKDEDGRPLLDTVRGSLMLYRLELKNEGMRLARVGSKPP